MGTATPVPTLDDVRQWPATVNVATAATALGISKSQLHELLRRNEAPMRALRLGHQWRVITTSLVRVLEDDAPDAESA